MAGNAKRRIWLLLCVALIGFVCAVKITCEAENSAQGSSDLSETEASQRQILLYALPEDYLSMPAEQIPHYRAGELHYYTMQEHNERAIGGHSPWMGSPLSAVPVFCQNLFEEYLIPSDYVEDYGPETTSFETPKGTTVRQLDEKITDGVQSTVVEINVPNDGCYTITFQIPPETVWPGYMGIITKILFCPSV